MMPALLLASACAFALVRVEPAEPSMTAAVGEAAAVHPAPAFGVLSLRGLAVETDGSVTLAGAVAPGADVFVGDVPARVDGRGVWTVNLPIEPDDVITVTLVDAGVGRVLVVDLSDVFGQA
jgi:hypothetical protein